MGKRSKNGLGFWVAAFAAFSAVVAFGWLHGADLWVLRTAQARPSEFLDEVSRVASLPGNLEVTGAVLLALVAWLFARGRRALAGRLLVAFIVTGLLELAMKFYLPQAPLLAETVRTMDYSPVVEVGTPYPYPSGHMLRGVFVFGALFLLSRSRLLRAMILLALLALTGSRVYLGVHWASDVVGGILLGIVGLLWAFGRRD